LPLFDVQSAYETATNHTDNPSERDDAGYCETAAILAYALGEPLSKVREYGRRALLAYREVLRRRPPLEKFQKPIGPGTWLEYSIGSSMVGVRYLYWALILREVELGREIAEQTWDPPEMGKIRVYPEYRVAYGVRELMLDRPTQALAELAQLPASAKSYLRQQATVISALAREARDEIVPALAELSNATHQAMRKEYLPHLKIFALPAAGLASYALDRGLLSGEDLPRDSDPFPISLVLPPE